MKHFEFYIIFPIYCVGQLGFEILGFSVFMGCLVYSVYYTLKLWTHSKNTLKIDQITPVIVVIYLYIMHYFGGKNEHLDI